MTKPWRNGAGAAAITVSVAWRLAAAGEPTPAEVFERRIMPVFKSPDPSGCVQCHLAGIDLKHYIRPSREETFRSLRDRGLIDLDKPGDSNILRPFRMGDDDESDPSSIHAKARQAEYDAFRAWVSAGAADPKLRDASRLGAAALAQLPRPDGVIRHARTGRRRESFDRNVWAWRFRWKNCNTEGTRENGKHRAEHGNRVAWVKKVEAEATMRYLMQSQLIDVKAPEKSLLLRKPLGEVGHAGGEFDAPGDQGFKGFRTWLKDYAATVNDRYSTPDELPRDPGPLRFGTDAWLKFADSPPGWGNRHVQLNVYAWDAARAGWESEAVATSDRGVWAEGRLAQHTLTLPAARGAERARHWKAATPSLTKGRYLVRVCVDRCGRLARDWRASLADADSAGQPDVISAWPEGYGRMTVLDAAEVRR